MFITIISTTSVAIGSFCSLFAIASCASTILEIPPGHPADARAEAAAPSRELLAAHATLSSSSALPTSSVASDAHTHHHAGDGHGTADAPTAAPGAKDEKDNAGSSWTCPMHPEVHKDGPGSCPICGMHLVQKKAPPPPRGKP